MGSYTRFGLMWSVPSAVKSEKVLLEIKAKVADFIMKNEEASIALEPNGCPADVAKWYDCERDLRAFSADVPGVLFVLHCEGEEARVWRVYAKNGKTAEVRPTIEWHPPRFFQV